MTVNDLIYKCKQDALKKIEDAETAEFQRRGANENAWYKVWEQAKDLLPDEVSNYLSIIVEGDFPPSHGSYFQTYLRLPDCLEIMIKFYTNYQTGNVEHVYEIIYVGSETFSGLDEAIGYAAIEWEKKEQQAAAMKVAEEMQAKLATVEKENPSKDWWAKMVQEDIDKAMKLHIHIHHSGE